MMSTTSQRLYEAIQTLPEPLQAEVLDFADFLRSRQASIDVKPSNVSLTSLCGGLENTQTFSGSPLSIQQQLRNDWR